MMRCARTPALLVLFLLTNAHLIAGERTVASTIGAVKVFLTGAEVTRTGGTGLPVGASTLLFTGLSEQVDPNNIQVTGQGAFTILGVSHRLDHEQEREARKEVQELEKRIEVLEADIAKENALVQLAGKEEARLSRNDVIGGDHGATLEQLRTTNEYMQQRLETLAMGSLTRQERIADMNERLSKLQLELTQLKGKKPTPTSVVVVEVTCNAPVEAKFTLKYQVAAAGWSPSYDIRVEDIARPLQLTYKAMVYQNTGEDWKDVVLSLSSGDPGKGAAMPVLQPWLLAFGRPQVVSPRYREHYRPDIRDVRGILRDADTDIPMPFVNVSLLDAEGKMINSATTNADGYYAIAVPENGRTLRFEQVGYKTQSVTIYSGTINQSLSQGALELKEVEIAGARAAVSRLETVQMSPRLIDRDGAALAQYMDVVPGVVVSGAEAMSVHAPRGGRAATAAAQTVVERATNFEFAIEVPYTIPSDGQNHHVGVQEHGMNARYRYYCTPKLDLDVFLFAKVTGWDTLNLLPGPAHIYFEGTYLGESELDLGAIGDTLDLSLGRDQGVTVQRTKRKDFSQKQTMGGKRADSMSWQLAVRNNKAQAVELIVTDQYPVALLSEIEVELVESSEASVNEEDGSLTWARTVDPRTNQQWTFTYRVKYPKGRIVVLE